VKRIAVISDPQINRKQASFQKQYDCLRRCFENMNVDSVIVCGDITENADVEEWNIFFKAFDQHCQTENLFLVPGNMDRVEQQTGRLAYDIALKSHFNSCLDTLYIMHETDSCILFGIAVERDDDDHPMSDLQLTRLAESLRIAAERGIPAIVFGHYILDGTIQTNWEYANLGPQSSAIRNLFEQLGGTVVYFSGHIHRGLMKAPGYTVAKINGVTYVSTPSICHPDKEHYKADNDNPGTGFLIELDQNSFQLKGYDFLNDEYLEDFDWTLQYV
jgi:predicted phosphodiesterase